MKTVKIKSLTSLRITALIIGLFMASLVTLVPKSALAAPSRCVVVIVPGVIAPGAPLTPIECSQETEIPSNIRTLLSVPAADDKCYTITYNVQDKPDVLEVNCTTDEHFKDASKPKVDRNKQAFKECNNADDPSSNCITTYITTIINVLSAGIVIIVIIMVIIGGIQYSAAGGDAQKVAAAKQRIFNALLALGAYIFLFVFLQWVIPGGWL